MSHDAADLAIHPEARRVRKKPVVVQVEFARESGNLATVEGTVRYEAGAALMTGSAGDRWPVERAKFDHGYAPVEGTIAGADGAYRKRPAEIWAIKLETLGRVRAGFASDVLEGQPGDWLVQYGAGDFGIVAAAIFDSTYDFLPAPESTPEPAANDAQGDGQS